MIERKWRYFDWWHDAHFNIEKVHIIQIFKPNQGDIISLIFTRVERLSYTWFSKVGKGKLKLTPQDLRVNQSKVTVTFYLRLNWPHIEFLPLIYCCHSFWFVYMNLILRIFDYQHFRVHWILRSPWCKIKNPSKNQVKYFRFRISVSKAM